MEFLLFKSGDGDFNGRFDGIPRKLYYWYTLIFINSFTLIIKKLL